MLWGAALKEMALPSPSVPGRKEQQEETERQSPTPRDDARRVDEMKRKMHSLEQDLVSSSAVRKRLEQGVRGDGQALRNLLPTAVRVRHLHVGK